jgi:hypothetical protein
VLHISRTAAESPVPGFILYHHLHPTTAYR